MSKIYQGSQLTITAAQSSDSSQGCFPCNENTLQDDELFFRTRRNSLDSRSILVRVCRNDIRNVAMADSVIGTRGWTLQEQLLSPRNVLCMNHDIHWQCRAGYQTQTGLSFDSKESLNNGGIVIPSRGLQLEDSVVRTAWRHLIEDYSLRKFTYSGDRIPATAGIVQHFASILDDVPILGLWAKSFATDLAWLRGGGEPQLSDVSNLPSWTWFICKGCVSYTIGDRYGDKKQQIEHLSLLDWTLEWDGWAYTSCIRQASVRVEGAVRDIPIAPFAEGNSHIPPYYQVFDENLKPSSKNKIPWRCAGRFDAADETEPATYLCLLLLSDICPSEPDYVYETFLILKAVKSHATKRYTRVGLARIWGEAPTFDRTKTMSMVLV